jgi:hypothetical protein
MLYPQIISKTKKTATEFKVDLKLFSASHKTDTVEPDTVINKLEEVTKYIRANSEVGTVDLPGEYVEGSFEMKWGPIKKHPKEGTFPIIYFGGKTADTIFGLAGSNKNFLGVNPTSEVCSYSQTPYIIGALSAALKMPKIIPSRFRNVGKGESLELIQSATMSMDGPFQRLSFIAKTLLYGTPSKKNDPGLRLAQKKVYLGTPLWVALDE